MDDKVSDDGLFVWPTMNQSTKKTVSGLLRMFSSLYLLYLVRYDMNIAKNFSDLQAKAVNHAVENS